MVNLGPIARKRLRDGLVCTPFHFRQPLADVLAFADAFATHTRQDWVARIIIEQAPHQVAKLLPPSSPNVEWLVHVHTRPARGARPKGDASMDKLEAWAAGWWAAWRQRRELEKGWPGRWPAEPLVAPLLLDPMLRDAWRPAPELANTVRPG